MRVQNVSRDHTLVNIELWWRARNWPVCRERRTLRNVRVLRCNDKRDGGAQRRADAAVWSGCTWLCSRAIRRGIKQAGAVDGADQKFTSANSNHRIALPKPGGKFTVRSKRILLKMLVL